MKKPILNSGFGYHILLPVIAILSVAGIGLYTMLHTSAAAKLPPITKLTYSTFMDPLACGVMEGGTSDGTYLYTACLRDKKKRNDHLLVVIYKVSIARKTIVASREFDNENVKGKDGDLAHANDMAYDSRRNKLVVSGWDNDKNTTRNKVLILDPDTLSLERTATLSGYKEASSANLCYNPDTDQYVAQGVLYNSDFKYVREIYTEKQVLKDLGMTAKSLSSVDQGVECDGSHIYAMWLSRTKYYARIAAYDWSGKITSRYQFSIGAEIENIALTDNSIYVGVNNGGISKAYAKKNKLKSFPSYTNDYYIKIDGEAF